MEQINLNQKEKDIKKKIEELESKKYRYFMSRTYLPGYGAIETLQTNQDILSAFNFVKSKFNVVDNNDAVELGLVDETSKEIQTYEGWSIEDYKEEFKTKVQEIKDEQTISQLENILIKLESLKSREDHLDELNDMLELIEI